MQSIQRAFNPRGRQAQPTAPTARPSAAQPAAAQSAPARPVSMKPNASATINAQVWFSQLPLRPTAGWVAAAGLLSAGYPGAGLTPNWQAVALLLLLVDPLWGSIWRLAYGRRALLPLTQQTAGGRVWLPYLQPGSPAAQLLGGNIGDVSPVAFRVALPGVLLALAVALVLNVQAVALTLLVVLISGLGWLGSRYLSAPPALLHAIVTVALPWWLTLAVIAPAVAPSWSSGDGAGGSIIVVLIGLWTLHNWGEGGLRQRATTASRQPIAWSAALLALADVGLIVLLLVARAPLWLALFVLLSLPTWLSILLNRPTAQLNLWWLAALLVSALGVGQAIG